MSVYMGKWDLNWNILRARFQKNMSGLLYCQAELLQYFSLFQGVIHTCACFSGNLDLEKKIYDGK